MWKRIEIQKMLWENLLIKEKNMMILKEGKGAIQ